MRHPARKPSPLRSVVCLLALLCAGMFAAPRVGAVLGDCGQPKTTGAEPSVADALEVLKTAVGFSNCGGHDACICDVDSTNGTTAADALRVLKKAVGQNVELVCPCAPTTTTTTTTLPVVHTTELLVLTKTQGSYATGDLAGTWDIASLASGPVAPWWLRGTLMIQSNGSMTGDFIESDGNTEHVTAKLALASNGIVTCEQNCGSQSFRGALDSGKTAGAITATWDDGSTELMVITKRPGSCKQSDLAGNWSLASLTSGPNAPWWMRGSATIGSNGSFDGDFHYSDGSSENVSATMTLSGSGHMSCSAGSCPNNFGGALDAGKTVGAVTATEDDGSTNLILFCKQAASYAQGDLTGTWNLNSLVTGAEEPLWSRGAITVAANGAMSGTINDSDNSTHQASGTLTITPSGVITHSDETDFRCAMDAGKTVAVCTTDR